MIIPGLSSSKIQIFSEYFRMEENFVYFTVDKNRVIDSCKYIFLNFIYIYFSLSLAKNELNLKNLKDFQNLCGKFVIF